MILDKFFLKYEGRVKLTPPPEKTTLRKPSPFFLKKFNLIESNCRTLKLILPPKLFLSLCRLLWLNPGSRREHLSSQLSRVTFWLLVTCVCCVYQVGELVLVFYDPLWLGQMVVLLTFFTHDEYDFSSMESWCYIREWLRNLRTKLCCIASGEWNVSRVSLQKFDIRYIMF